MVPRAIWYPTVPLIAVLDLCLLRGAQTITHYRCSKSAILLPCWSKTPLHFCPSGLNCLNHEFTLFLILCSIQLRGLGQVGVNTAILQAKPVQLLNFRQPVNRRGYATKVLCCCYYAQCTLLSPNSLNGNTHSGSCLNRMFST